MKVKVLFPIKKQDNFVKKFNKWEQYELYIKTKEKAAKEKQDFRRRLFHTSMRAIDKILNNIVSEFFSIQNKNLQWKQILSNIYLAEAIFVRQIKEKKLNLELIISKIKSRHLEKLSKQQLMNSQLKVLQDQLTKKSESKA